MSGYFIEIFNASTGVEYFVNPTFSVLAGFSTDVSAVPDLTGAGTSHVAADGNFVNAVELLGSMDISPDGQVTATWQQHHDAPSELVIIDAKGTKRVVLTASAPGQVRFLER